MKDFQENFKIIENKFKELVVKNGLGERSASRTALIEFLEVTSGKLYAWSKGQWPSVEDCLMLREKFGFSLEWLCTGEGDPHGEGAPPTPQAGQYTAPAAQPGLPMVGFASCGVHNSADMIMPFSVTAAPPSIGPRGLVAVAQGESMVPAGILPGQMCYCDPDLEPGEGEAVYMEQVNGRGTIKSFLRRTETSIFLRGWLPQTEQGQRKEFEMEVQAGMVKSLAPVVWVKRRL